MKYINMRGPYHLGVETVDQFVTYNEARKMKYYKLNFAGTAWGAIDTAVINLSDYKQIKLYDDNLVFIGMGLY